MVLAMSDVAKDGEVIRRIVVEDQRRLLSSLVWRVFGRHRGTHRCRLCCHRFLRGGGKGPSLVVLMLL